MTPIQKRALDLIEHRYAADGICPSYQELADELGFASKSNAHRLFHALTRAGYLVRSGSRTRGYVPTRTGPLRDVTTDQLRAELAKPEAARG